MEEKVAKLAGRKPGIMGRDNFLVSAVFLPLINWQGELALLFEVRSKHLDRQPGEICFPGGRVEEYELLNPEQTAVREAAEELGLHTDELVVDAPLDFLVTPMGAIVYPYVGRINAPDNITPNRDEVESVFTVPLSFLSAYKPQKSIVDVATRYNKDFPLHRVSGSYHRGWQKRWSYPSYIYEYENYFIWGITAIILHHFLHLLHEERC